MLISPANIEPVPTIEEVDKPTPTQPAITPAPMSPVAIPTVPDRNKSVHDTKSAAWMYAHGYYGNGGSSQPLNPIPEASSFMMVLIGVAGVVIIARKK